MLNKINFKLSILIIAVVFNACSDTNLNKSTIYKNPKINKVDSCLAFYSQFPSTFEDFIKVYGYSPELGKALLYDQYDDDIRFFIECEGVSDSMKLKKLIGIGVNGHWEADAISKLQFETLKLTKKNPKVITSILKRLENSVAASFWYFLFDGPNPNDHIIQSDIDSLCILFGKNSQQSILLMEQFELLINQTP